MRFAGLRSHRHGICHGPVVFSRPPSALPGSRQLAARGMKDSATDGWSTAEGKTDARLARCHQHQAAASSRPPSSWPRASRRHWGRSRARRPRHSRPCFCVSVRVRRTPYWHCYSWPKAGPASVPCLWATRWGPSRGLSVPSPAGQCTAASAVPRPRGARALGENAPRPAWNALQLVEIRTSAARVCSRSRRKGLPGAPLERGIPFPLRYGASQQHASSMLRFGGQPMLVRHGYRTALRRCQKPGRSRPNPRTIVSFGPSCNGHRLFRAPESC